MPTAPTTGTTSAPSATAGSATTTARAGEPACAVRDAALTILAAQRASVLTIVDGLDEASMRRSVVPSGWTPLGVVEHLAGAEVFWFDVVAAGRPPTMPWPGTGSEGPWVSDHPVAEVLAFYRDQARRSDAALAQLAWDEPPRGFVPPDMPELAVDVATIVLHVIEETARHAGHLDIARELLDGRTGLGPR